MSAVVRGSLGFVACRRRGKPCPRLSADDETLRICEKTLVRDVRDVRRSKIYDFLFVRGLSRTFVDLW